MYAHEITLYRLINHCMESIYMCLVRYILLGWSLTYKCKYLTAKWVRSCLYQNIFPSRPLHKTYNRPNKCYSLLYRICGLLVISICLLKDSMCYLKLTVINNSLHNSPQRNVLPSLIFPEESQLCPELQKSEDEAEVGQNMALSHTVQTCHALPRTDKAKNNFHVSSSILQIKVHKRMCCIKLFKDCV